LKLVLSAVQSGLGHTNYKQLADAGGNEGSGRSLEPEKIK
jgi:hypothetical protein